VDVIAAIAFHVKEVNAVSLASRYVTTAVNAIALATVFAVSLALRGEAGLWSSETRAFRPLSRETTLSETAALVFANVSKTFNGVTVLDGVSLTVRRY
jgi:hypothetical protein